MSNPSATKYEITDRIVEKLGFRNHQGASSHLTRLNLETLKWLEEGIDLLKPNLTKGMKTKSEVESKSKELVSLYKEKGLKISAIKDLREWSNGDLGLKESLDMINRYW